MTEPGLLTIAAVRQLTGLSERQIRYYDERGLVVPRRSVGGHRLYTPAQVQQLTTVARLLSEGRSVEQIRLLLQQPESQVKPKRQPVSNQPYDERGLEDVKLYFRSLSQRNRNGGR